MCNLLGALRDIQWHNIRNINPIQAIQIRCILGISSLQEDVHQLCLRCWPIPRCVLVHHPLGDEPPSLRGSNTMQGLQHGNVFPLVEAGLVWAGSVEPRKTTRARTGSLNSALTCIRPRFRPRRDRALKIAETLWKASCFLHDFGAKIASSH